MLAPLIQGEVYTDDLRRYQLSTDASIFRKMPTAVVYPKTTRDVQETIRFAIGHGFSVHPRGAGSGLCGSAVGGGIVIDFSKHKNRLIKLDTRQGWFACEPGFRFGELAEKLQGTGWFFPPDPSSGEYATFGGMCATNASGAHSVKYGNVADYLLDARIVFADGYSALLSEIQSTPIDQLPRHLAQLARLYQKHAPDIESAYPNIACNVAGYNLRGLVQNERLHLHRLISGSEGSLGITTLLRFRLLKKPETDTLVVAYFDTIVLAAQAVQYAVTLSPSGIEIMDKSLLQVACDSDPSLKADIPGGIDNVLLIEFDGPPEVCAQQAQTLQQHLETTGLTRQANLALNAAEKEKFWSVRKAAVPTLYKLKGRRKILALVEDAAVPVDQLVPYFEGVYSIFARLDVEFVLYGHIAKGLMHTRPLLDLKDPHDVALLKPIADAFYELVDGLGGTVSGEHGDGRLRSAYIQRRYAPIYDILVRTKHLLDPQSMFNPEIKIQNDPEQMARHLRFGSEYHSNAIAKLRLNWHDTFITEVEKCHGCSKCTTVTTATRMCPVYKFTRDEDASPKAKANVLRALISGQIAQGALYQKTLQRVMACCVNCGSCYLECPSNVNIPKMAMEAKAQYVRRFGPTLPDRLTSQVEIAARMTHKFSPLIRPMVRRPAVRKLAARLAGLAPEREMVVFDRRCLYERVPKHTAGNGPRVIYYAGCYAGYIRPALGEATVQVLTRLGFEVDVPTQFCCGLPQLSKGLTADARSAAQRNLNSWQNTLQKADYIVVTCSSCGYALMQDWFYLLPKPSARQVKEKTVHISDLLTPHTNAPQWSTPPIKLAYHHPCHLRLQPNSTSSLTLLNALPGVTMTDLKSHCCGIAGSWGMIAKNYDLSKTIATPMIEKLNTAEADFGITDCPTCQMQMEHLGNKPIKHPVEIVWERMKDAELMS